MFQNDLLKLSVTVVLLVATAFVSVATVAADPWYPVKAGDAAAPSDWFERHPDSANPVSVAGLSDYFQRHPGAIRSKQYYRLAVASTVDLSDYFQRHPSSTVSGDAAGSLMYYGPPGR